LANFLKAFIVKLMTKQKFDANAFYERLYDFARRCRELTEKLPKTIANVEYSSQLIRASGSMGSNYIEALEATGKKDFVYRLRVSRKETKESVHWLRLILDANKDLNTEVGKELRDLIDEGREIMKIFTSSILTCEGKKKLENR
jgi:four helix bundle protein